MQTTSQSTSAKGAAIQAFHHAPYHYILILPLSLAIIAITSKAIIEANIASTQDEKQDIDEKNEMKETKKTTIYH
jgi:hypothetical protein